MAAVTIDRVSKRFGAVMAVDDLTLRIADREFVSFLGPSGCGKTTTLNMVAGLERPSAGAIFIGERDVTEVPAMHRDAAMVFQSYALYPHMTVAKNLGFALKVRGLPAGDIAARTRRAADMLGLGDLLGRYPRQLSGGQRQRVALGRALVRDPQVFLLDEPLSNLDAVLRVQTRAELKRLFQQLGTTTIYVTHDQSEAMTMSDRIAVFSKGVLQQVGTPLDVYRAPANRFVASFVGSPPMTFFPATIAGDGTLRAGGLALPLPERLPASARGRDVVLGLRPEDVRLDETGTPGVIEIVEHLGSGAILHVDAAGQRIVSQLADADRYRVGDRVGVSVAPRGAYLFDAVTGGAILTPGNAARDGRGSMRP